MVSSLVPQEWLKVINENGGNIGETYGVPVEQIVEAIKHGVRKVNIDTDLRLASTGAIRKFLAENPSEFDPRKSSKPLWLRCQISVPIVSRPLVLRVRHIKFARSVLKVWSIFINKRVGEICLFNSIYH